MFLLLAVLLAIGDFTWGTTNDPNQKSLWQDGKQIGVWKIAEKEYLTLTARGWVHATCPVDDPQDPPPDFVGPPERPKESTVPSPGEINYGLDRSKCPTEGEYFSYSGTPIDKAKALAVLGAMDGQTAQSKVDPDQLTDDHQSARLTVVGKGADKLLATIQADSRWAELGKGVLAADYKPDAWQLRGKGYKATSPDKPTIYLTDSEGKILYQGEDPEGLFDGLRRKRDPWTFKWNSTWFGVNPFTWMFGAGWSNLQIPIEFVLLVIGAIVVGILALRKKPGPPGQPTRGA